MERYLPWDPFFAVSPPITHSSGGFLFIFLDVFIHLLVHSFNQCILRAYYAGCWGRTANKTDKAPTCMELTVLWGERRELINRAV